MLVTRHYRLVFAVCLGMLGNIHDAEDMAQDAAESVEEAAGDLADKIEEDSGN